jgi:hypothetical protein
MLPVFIIALVTVIGIIGAVVSMLSRDQVGGRTPPSIPRKGLRRGSQQLQAIEAALVTAETKPPPRCSVPHASGRSRRR